MNRDISINNIDENAYLQLDESSHMPDLTSIQADAPEDYLSEDEPAEMSDMNQVDSIDEIEDDDARKSLIRQIRTGQTLFAAKIDTGFLHQYLPLEDQPLNRLEEALEEFKIAISARGGSKPMKTAFIASMAMVEKLSVVSGLNCTGLAMSYANDQETSDLLDEIYFTRFSDKYIKPEYRLAMNVLTRIKQLDMKNAMIQTNQKKTATPVKDEIKEKYDDL